MNKFISTFFGMTVLVAHCAASTVTIFGDLADTQVHKGGIHSGDPTQNGGQSGMNGGFDYSMVYVFQLPVLAPNEFISSAHFSFFVTAAGSIYNTDLYGLSHRALPGVLPSDWYTGTGDPNNTLIQAAIVPPSFTFTGRTATSPSGDNALVNFLNNEYAAGAVGGNYVFLRLSTNAVNPINVNTNFYYAADDAFYLAGILGQSTLPMWQERFSPRLDVSTVTESAPASVPEPASVTEVLVGLGMLAVARLLRAR